MIHEENCMHSSVSSDFVIYVRSCMKEPLGASLQGRILPAGIDWWMGAKCCRQSSSTFLSIAMVSPSSWLEYQKTSYPLFSASSLICRSSEGERIALSFGDIVPQIGVRVRKDIAENKPLFILLDGLDSGASIDRTRELMSLFELIERDANVIPLLLRKLLDLPQ